MTVKQVAQMLDGREYLEEMSRGEEAGCEKYGIVVVFGQSDDLIELRGAIDGEEDCYAGGFVYLDKEGVLPNRAEIDDNNFATLKAWHDRRNNAKMIEAVWMDDPYSWQYVTDIPHETFDIKEGDDLYCKGIVFSINDL